MVFVGDFNINVNDQSKSQTLLFLDRLESYDLKQIINEPTRIARNTSTILDLMLVSSHIETEQPNIEDINVLGGNFDHMLVSCVMLNDNVPEINVKFKHRNLKRIDNELFQSHLSLTPFQNIFYLNNVDDKVELLSNYILSLFDVHAPLEEITVRHDRLPWVTDVIRIMMKERDAAFRKYKKTKKSSDWICYKQIRNHVTSAIKIEKRQYLNDISRLRDSKQTWRALQRLQIHSRQIKRLPDVLNKPDEINDFLLDSLQRSTSSNGDLISYYEQNTKTNFTVPFNFSVVSELVVYEYLLCIKSNAVGADGLSIVMLLMCCPVIIPYITHIINEVLLTGVFPLSWKVSKICPIPKVNKPTNYSHLRGISILPALSKVTEKIMYEQIGKHLTDNCLLPQLQSGFRRGHSCATALTKILDDILSASDKRLTTILLLLDYSRAFDTVDHEVLTAMCHYVGFSTQASLFMKSYLNRYQYVETNAGISRRRYITSGIPQGSILGPVLFSLYISNIITSIKHCSYHLYADDTQLYYSFSPSEVHDANLLINEDLRELSLISESHNLHLNETKTKLMIFNSQQNVSTRVHIKIKGKRVLPVDDCINLGVHFNVRFKFTSHINLCLKRAYYNLKMIYPHRSVLNTEIKKTLCESLVLSHLTYGDVVYDSFLTEVDKSRIEKVQRCCMRFIYGIRKFERVTHKLKELNWLTMENRRKLHILILYRRIMIEGSPPYLRDRLKFRTDIHNINIRHKGLLTPPPHRTSLFQKSFSFKICKMINNLPIELVEISMRSFRIKCKEFLLNQQWSLLHV